MRITLCGSTRFKDLFEQENARLTLAGHVVYSLAMFGRTGADVGKPETNIIVTDEQKIVLDRVHKKKIDNSDAIYVINPEGYIGDSTKSEIAHAESVHKDVYYLGEL